MKAKGCLCTCCADKRERERVGHQDTDGACYCFLVKNPELWCECDFCEAVLARLIFGAAESET